MHQIKPEAEDDDDNDNNNEQFFNIGSLVNCNSVKSKINAYLTVKDYASVKYKILFNLDTVAEVNIVVSTDEGNDSSKPAQSGNRRFKLFGSTKVNKSLMAFERDTKQFRLYNFNETI